MSDGNGFTGYLVDVGGTPESDLSGIADLWRSDQPWPLPPLHDLPAGGFAVMCFGCGHKPLDQRCESCPRVSTRLYREWRDQPRLPASRWRRFFSTFERKGKP